MAKIIHSNNNVKCQKCEAFLLSVHPELADWFRSLRVSFSQVHVAVGWRGEKEQNNAFKCGASKLCWPKSQHNAFDICGNPCSRAIDLFQLDEDGVAKFEDDFYLRIANLSSQRRDPIRWGGTFKTIHDADHFELK